MKALLSLFFLLLAFGNSHSQTCLDSTFTENWVNQHKNSWGAIALDKNDNIYYAGQRSANHVLVGLEIGRLTKNGLLDSSFGNNGVVLHSSIKTTPIDAHFLSDGKLSLALYEFRADSLPVVRLNADGSIDRSYGENGFVKIIKSEDSAGHKIWKPANFEIHGLAYTETGEIILGHAESGSGENIILCKIDRNGKIDTLFGNDGYAYVNNGFYGGSMAGIMLDKEGKIMVCGSGMEEDRITKFMMMRFLPDGSLDSSFNGNGKKYFTLSGPGLLYALAAALQEDGKILFAGSEGDGVLMRLHPDGRLDSSFNQVGYIRLPDSLQPEVIRLYQDKIIIGAFVGETGSYSYGISILDREGNTLDLLCGNSLFKYRYPDSRDNRIYNTIIQKNGKIILSGISYPENSWLNSQWLLILLKSPLPEMSYTSCGTIYPNPASSYFKISSADAVHIIRYRLYDPSGRLLLRGAALPANGLYIEHLAAGNYYLKTETATGKQCNYTIIRQ